MVRRVVALHCTACDRRLLEYLPVAGLFIRVRCRRCGTWVEVRIDAVA